MRGLGEQKSEKQQKGLQKRELWKTTSSGVFSRADAQLLTIDEEDERAESQAGTVQPPNAEAPQLVRKEAPRDILIQGIMSLVFYPCEPCRS